MYKNKRAKKAKLIPSRNLQNSPDFWSSFDSFFKISTISNDWSYHFPCNIPKPFLQILETHRNSVKFVWGLSLSLFSKLHVFLFPFFSSFPKVTALVGILHSSDSTATNQTGCPLWETKAKSHEEIFLLKIAVFEILKSLQLFRVRLQPLQACILDLQPF